MINVSYSEQTKIPDQLFRGRYEDISVIGKGGFGLILKITEKSSGISFAAKVMKIDAKEDQELVDHELVLYTAGLTHKNIVQIFKYVHFFNWHMFVMELGMCNLMEEFHEMKLKMNRGKRFGFSFFHTVRILSDVLEALIYTSNKNICYRDVKPNNVIKFGDIYKLADWGTAYKKKENDELTIEIKKMDAIAGTFLYMSPELATEISKGKVLNEGQKSQDLKINFEKSDVFSLGMLILQIYFGFSPKELVALKKEIMNDSKEIGINLIISNDGRDAPEEFCLLVSQMLSLDYSFRPRLTDIKVLIDKHINDLILNELNNVPLVELSSLSPSKFKIFVLTP